MDIPKYGEYTWTIPHTTPNTETVTVEEIVYDEAGQVTKHTVKTTKTERGAAWAKTYSSTGNLYATA